MKEGYRRRMERRVLNYVREHGMIRSGERVLVGVSGGVDSCVLLDCLVRLRRELGCELVVAHMNHRLRGEEAEADARFVRELAASYGLACIEESHDVAAYARKWRIGIEVSGRKLRYEFFLRAARKTGCQAVAVAHHADDQVETVLWRLLRGSGPRGLRGMVPVRPLAERRLIRPLLPFYRAEIEAYARERRLSYRVDASNDSRQYTRNRIRHELLPLLMTYNPQIKERILALAEQLGLEDELLEEQARSWVEQWFRLPVDGSSASPGGELPLLSFSELHPALQWRVGKLILEYLLDAGVVRRVHVADLQKLARSRPGAALHLPDGWVARRTADAIRFEKNRPASPKLDYTYPFPSGPLYVPEADVTLAVERLPYPLPATVSRGSREALFDAASFPAREAVIRNRRPGDWMWLEAGGGQGRTFTKKVKALMNEAKWPQEKRWRMPVLAIGDEVLWVPGLRQSVRFRPAEDTKEVWRVVLKEGHRGGNHGAGHSEDFTDGGAD